MFQVNKIIIYSDDTFNCYENEIKMPCAKYTIVHERMHKEMDSLEPEEQEIMKGAFYDLTRLKIYEINTKEGINTALKDGISKEEIDKALNKKAVVLSLFDREWHFGEYATKNYDEFFAVLAEGHFPKRIEMVLQRDKQEAYKIFQVMKHNSRLK